MLRIWVDQNDLREGARPLLVTELGHDPATRPTPETKRARKIIFHGPSVLRFDPENTGLARVWIETDSAVELIDACNAGY